ncbi:hypothetical protein BSLG_006228 [Batrachochytrium salamandrivorans]|nr:hypothetical protein BSLG_006228 [Batrachochytrium salamandrivorans]
MGLLQQQHIPSLESSTTHTAMQQQHLQKHQTAIAAVHRCRFVQYTPSAIVSLAFAPASAKRQRYLAAARANGNIELWNPRGKSWFLERTIPGSPEAPIESVVWVHQTIDPSQSVTELDADMDMDSDDQETQDHPTHISPPQIPLKSSSPRLFSAGLTGLITEYDLTSLLPRHETDSFGGPIWCMAANHAQSHLAVGCEDGYVRIFKILPLDQGSIEFVATVEKQVGRVMSLAWHPTDKFLVVGSVKNIIRKICVATGRSVHRMVLDTVRGEDTIVWDLQILQPSLGNGQTSEVIVAADSLGYVTFWDWNTATLRKCVKAHGADALCLASNAAGTRVFSAGVDRKVVEITLADISLPTASSNTKGLGKKSGSSSARLANSSNHSGSHVNGKRAPISKTSWIISGQKRYHTHDVRALLYIEDRPFDAIVSGGVDTSLIFSSPALSFNKMKQHRMPLHPHSPLVSIAPAARLVMSRFDDSVNVWRLGDIDPTLSDFNSGNESTQGARQMDIQPSFDDHQRLDHAGHKLLMTIKFKGRTNLCASAISADGCWIALADLYSVKVYRVILPSELSCGAFSLSNGLAKPVSGNTALPVIKRVKKVPVTGGASVLIFSPDSSRLVIAGTDSFVRVVLLGTPLDDSMQVAAVFEQHAGTNHHINRHSMNHSKASGESSKDKNERAVVILACICADSRFLATTDALNRIYVFDLESLQLHTSLPVFSSLLTCMVFHPGRVSHESTPTPTTTSPFSPPTLIFTSTTNELVMYDIGLCKAGGRMSHWSRVNSHRLPQAFVERREIVMGVCVDPAAPMRLIVWGAYMVCFIDLTVQPIDVSTTSTKSKLKGIWRSSSGSDLNHAIKKRSVEDRDCRDVDRAEGEIVLRNEPQDQSGRKLASVQVTLQKGFVVDTRYQSIMYLGFCGSQIVVVERPVLHVLAALPTAFYKHKYGT